MQILIDTEDELFEAASEILRFDPQMRCFLFHGEMGSGKTTLIKQLSRQLGVADTVSSPTYSIVNEYRGSAGIVYHFDFYRIKSQSEAFDIGFEEYVASGHYCFIEWPEMIPDLFPEEYIKVSIQATESGTRILNYTRVPEI